MPHVLLQVKPKRSLADESLNITATNLEPGQEVTLVARMTENKTTFVSSACFVANQNGEVDVSQQASISGSYTGIDPVGLVWSMGPDYGHSYGGVLKKNASTPYTIHVTVYDGHVINKDCSRRTPGGAPDVPVRHQGGSEDCDVLATDWFERFYKADSVRRLPIRTGRVRGVMFLPNDPGPHLGVIEIPGSRGGLCECRAALLASRGFVTFAIAYFAYLDLPKTLEEIDLDYFEEAVDWFTSLPVVAGATIALHGVSLGADIACQLATVIPKVNACVCIGGCYFNFLRPMRYKDTVLNADKMGFNESLFVRHPKGIVLKHSRNKSPSADTIYNIERSSAEFLFIHGEDDQCNDPDYCRKLADRLRAHGKTNYSAVIYPGTGHLIEPPYTPLIYAAPNRVIGEPIIMGGHVCAHASAQVDCWKRTLSFLVSNLKPYEEKARLTNKL